MRKIIRFSMEECRQILQGCPRDFEGAVSPVIETHRRYYPRDSYWNGEGRTEVLIELDRQEFADKAVKMHLEKQGLTPVEELRTYALLTSEEIQTIPVWPGGRKVIEIFFEIGVQEDREE